MKKLILLTITLFLGLNVLASAQVPESTSSLYGGYISGNLFFDNNANGVYDIETETTYGHYRVGLYDSNDALISSYHVDDYGQGYSHYYSFYGLSNGKYTVKLEPYQATDTGKIEVGDNYETVAPNISTFSFEITDNNNYFNSNFGITLKSTGSDLVAPSVWSSSQLPDIIYKEQLTSPNVISATGVAKDNIAVTKTYGKILRIGKDYTYLQDSILTYNNVTSSYLWARDGSFAPGYTDQLPTTYDNVTKEVKITLPDSSTGIYKDGYHYYVEFCAEDAVNLKTCTYYDYYLSSKYDNGAIGDLPLFRFWSNKLKGHFYTSSEWEKNQVLYTYDSDTWAYEMESYKVNNCTDTASTPVYRFWSDTKQHHFYTNNEAEKTQIQWQYPSNVWKFETIAFCAYKTQVDGTLPVYRFWSDKMQSHFYTISDTEKSYIVNNYPTNVWKFEGVAYYARPIVN